MRLYTAILMGSLITTTAFTGPVFAQQSSLPSTMPSTAPVSATSTASSANSASSSSSKSAQKEKVQMDSAKLSPEKAKLYNDTMQKAIDDNKEVREQIHKAFQEADNIMTAEKFDKAAFLAKAKELDQLYAKMRDKNNEAFVSVVEKFSQEDRKILLKARNEHRHSNQQQQ